MSFNPQTLQDETDEERRERVGRTGVIGRGLTVLCFPTDEPLVFNSQHRAVCILKPYAKCGGCPHSHFKALFKPGLVKAKQELIMCPKWNSRQDEIDNKPPDHYDFGQTGTCDEQPFNYCRKCPSRSELIELGIDKAKDGWLNRWEKYNREEEEDD